MKINCSWCGRPIGTGTGEYAAGYAECAECKGKFHRSRMFLSISAVVALSIVLIGLLNAS
jgi:hypothetical protein